VSLGRDGHGHVAGWAPAKHIPDGSLSVRCTGPPCSRTLGNTCRSSAADSSDPQKSSRRPERARRSGGSGRRGVPGCFSCWIHFMIVASWAVTRGC
jgi:hypothetical protein